MSMSTSVIGFVSPDDPTYQKHLKVLMACIEADIEALPKETADYFGYDYPEECAAEEKLLISIPIKEWGDENSEGYELIVSDIPEGVHKIRFANSW